MSDGIKVDYAEIDRLTTGITALNTFAGPLVPKVGALSIDGDLLASAILSPGTALAAEGAVINASAQLSVTIVSTKALVIITASISKVYEAAEAGLAAALAGLSVGVHEAFAFGVQVAVNATLVTETVVYTTVALSFLAKDAVESGVAADVLGIAGHSIAQAFAASAGQQGTLTDRLSVFVKETARNFGENFMAELPKMSPKLVSMEEAWLGDLRGSGTYDGLLATLIAGGQRLGSFQDGKHTFLEGLISPEERTKRSEDAVFASESALDTTLKTDADGNIIPTDLQSLLASAGQIDAVGQQDFGDIRITKVVGPDGIERYTVQIPSTQSWDPVAGRAPNDLTSDVHAMRYGSNTALAEAVKDAMRREGIVDQPVMLVGFSLGGITAGAIAADPDGFNVQQVVTAGSPVGAMRIPDTTHVTSFESTSDPVAALDGTLNPARPSWQTIRGDAPIKADEDIPMASVVDAHDANRYAVMAQQQGRVNASDDIAKFLGTDGTKVSMNDWEAWRIP
ncbi:hypothetical protein HUN58_17405 [Curtobacterium sp. Csp1]|uniref:Uncharacterized protein n=1 Tax=Curtobacterium citreum TaxID=2036 RepID=A0ABT2HFQ2_9MICO|nr:MULTISPECIES: hypothetical protein [Curtobacterium]MCS6522102.1 hypothetical protein [Curtobacterium citreum]QKS11966.1 hypothetical protein HUN60_01500 [Curtobacterium sp. csp3]QKS21474.1 hypothetical protein HUN58_17405 [Curtobacterium sp. Csp1]TQJ27494.1 hypothetical protein FB462_1349 [Curtobacterium citreum]GGL77537.1 hypothetical protein GCM10009706_15050 [Curtobacterium citreum]